MAKRKRAQYSYSGSVTIGNKSKLRAFREHFRKKGYKMKTRKDGDFIHVYYKPTKKSVGVLD